jgi:acyl-CoA synthetase (AMP-forming)/AMP-acid ligase II
VLGAAECAGLAPVEPLLAAAAPGEPADQVCGSLLLYTSGTTGAPKGVVNGLFTTGAPVTRVEALLGYAGHTLGIPADGRILLVGPWYHSAQLFFALLPLLRGSSLVIHGRFDARATLAAIDLHGITMCHLVPTQFVRLLALPAADRADFAGTSLKRVWHGAASCPPDVKRQMIDWWGPVLVEYYAATEGGIVTMIDSVDWLDRPGSVGRPVPPTEVLVVGPDGAELPPGTVGRVYLRRKRRRTFHYHNAPDKTRAAHLDADVFTYGELGRLDADGYLYLTGRETDMILSGGVNIYPAEVESVLLAHPEVRDAAVIGVPDPEFGERVLAVVQPATATADLAELASTLDRHCRATLAGFKVPRRYELTGGLPRDDNGKLRKQVLRAPYWEHEGGATA